MLPLALEQINIDVYLLCKVLPANPCREIGAGRLSPAVSDNLKRKMLEQMNIKNEGEMQKYSREFSVGLFMILGLACLAYMTVKLGKMEVFGDDGYVLSARFNSVTGLKTGAAVEIAGVRVGKVTGVSLNKDFSAKVGLLINKGIDLSDDSIASVKTSGLIGDKFISLSPGSSEKILAAGDELWETESSVDIEALISKYVFGGVK